MRTYGEERYAGQISRAIVRRRETQPFSRSADLVDVVRGALPIPARFGEGHPAKRVFQALRIAVNRELEGLDAFVHAALARLQVGGRLAVIAFHSLEDRIVKHTLRALAQGPNPSLAVLTKRPVIADDAETAMNPRSRSAKLRAAEAL